MASGCLGALIRSPKTHWTGIWQSVAARGLPPVSGTLHSMPLDEYRRKRDFGKTPEPAPAAVRGHDRTIRHPAPSRHPAPLRLPPRDRRRPRQLGSPQGPDARLVGQADGRPRRGPPDRVFRLRGRDPGQAIRRRRRDRLGLGHMGTRGAHPRPAPRGRGRRAEVHPPRPEGQRPLHDRPDQRPAAEGRRPCGPRLRGRRRASSGC